MFQQVKIIYFEIHPLDDNVDIQDLMFRSPGPTVLYVAYKCVNSCRTVISLYIGKTQTLQKKNPSKVRGINPESRPKSKSVKETDMIAYSGATPVTFVFALDTYVSWIRTDMQLKHWMRTDHKVWINREALKSTCEHLRRNAFWEHAVSSCEALGIFPSL